MNRIDEKVKKETLAHYERMIAWAEKQGDSECAEFELVPDVMFEDIGEAWEAQHCPICSFYHVGRREWTAFPTGCRNCPLSLSDNDCNDADSFWVKMDDSESWSNWIIYAKKLYEVIKQL